MQMLGLVTYRNEKSNETPVRNVLCGDTLKSLNKCNLCSETIVVRLKVEYVFRITQERTSYVLLEVIICVLEVVCQR